MVDSFWRTIHGGCSCHLTRWAQVCRPHILPFCLLPLISRLMWDLSNSWIRRKSGEHTRGAHVITAQTLRLVPQLLGIGGRAKSPRSWLAQVWTQEGVQLVHGSGALESTHSTWLLDKVGQEGNSSKEGKALEESKCNCFLMRLPAISATGCWRISSHFRGRFENSLKIQSPKRTVNKVFYASSQDLYPATFMHILIHSKFPEYLLFANHCPRLFGGRVDPG